jgi:glycosyltransferase involved in cell wall biosynthesis
VGGGWGGGWAAAGAPTGTAIGIGLECTLAGGGTATARLGEIAVTAGDGHDETAPPFARSGARSHLIAVCMATFDPDITLFERQLDSLRAQDDDNWVCVISDDCSSPERFAAIQEAVGDDPRFAISRSEERLGFYRNFERALRLVPPAADFVALCDQDDRWYADKLSTLRASIGGAVLAYSDLRLADPDGRVIAGTLYGNRRNNHTNLTSQLIHNSIPGAAMLFRRELLDIVLPFPEAPGWQFHDHWIGTAALASGDVTFVASPLYDYVQHGGAVLRGQIGAQSETNGARAHLRRLRDSVVARTGRSASARWRSAYFYAYLPLRLHAEVLRMRATNRLTPRKRRVLDRFIAADGSPFAPAWLTLRRLRALVGHAETEGREARLARGLAWRAVAHRSRDASLPPFEPE